MNPTTAGIEDKVERFLDILGTDIEHVKKSISCIDELRALVIKRDDAALSRLLENIHAESDDYKTHELIRRKMREELAAALDCNPEQVTLTVLQTVLQGETASRAARTRATLASLMNELRKEYLSTTLLLSDCAGFNKLLLRSIFALGKTGTVTYSSKGSPKEHSETAFLNLQL